MSEFSYSVSASLEPSSGGPGTQVTLSASITDVKGEVGRVFAFISGYGQVEQLQPAGDGKYVLKRTVPYEAPMGTYQLRIYAVDTEGRRGPEATASFSVT